MLFVSPAFAATIQLTSSQTQLNFDEEFTVNVSLAISTSSTYYLRGMFHKPGISKYCGFTWNGSSWYNGPYTPSGLLNLLPATPSGGTWAGELKARIDTGDSGCKDSGIYKFKVLRYTTGGSSSDDGQTEVSLNVFIPTPTATPVPTSTPTKIPTPTRTPNLARRASPTKVPTLPAHINISTAKPLKISSALAKIREKIAISGVLGESTQSATPKRLTPTGYEKNATVSPSFIASATGFNTFIGIGGLLLVAAGGTLAFQFFKKRKNG